MSVTTPWVQIWFDSPDGAYLVSAAIRRYLAADLVPDVLLVPSRRGPALELPQLAADDPLVNALVRRFGGHIDGRAVADDVRRRLGEDRRDDPARS